MTRIADRLFLAFWWAVLSASLAVGAWCAFGRAWAAVYACGLNVLVSCCWLFVLRGKTS